MSNFPITSSNDLSLFAKNLLKKVKFQEKGKSAIKSHNTFLSAIAESIPNYSFNIHSLKSYLQSQENMSDLKLRSQHHLLGMIKAELKIKIENHPADIADAVYLTTTKGKGIELDDIFDGTVGDYPIVNCSNIKINSTIDFQFLKLAIHPVFINEAYQELDGDLPQDYITLENRCLSEAYKILIGRALFDFYVKLGNSFVEMFNNGKIDKLSGERWNVLVQETLNSFTLLDISQYRQTSSDKSTY
ncbi:hypothetical protein [Shewanella sp. 6_MG-2023]|uniref:hypothetical protein n=1 Tax=Shewanella sp. 6_MG-2023 TaxID=3062660 RepID=UPI0026E13143|nr:hypothetical protein [Shewanella sp. 6_MG-2023]MDO6621085.1 hypothetical protein [Shewanella sp. 6_MG-2023]